MATSTIKRKLFIFIPILLLYGISCVAALTPEELAKLALDSTVYFRTQDPEGKSYIASGFVIGEGVIATNHHVIEEKSIITVRLLGETTRHTVQSIHADKQNDLAIVIAPGIRAPVLPLGDSDTVQVGMQVYVMGNPKGREGTFSDGLISAIRPKNGRKEFQMTAPVSGGSSGGPVLNSSGEVIGITVSQVPDGQNLNFAVPVNYLKTLAVTIVTEPPRQEGVVDGTIGTLYWTDSNRGTKLQRANLDGSNVQNIVTQGLESPRYIALDVAVGKMYWADGFFGTAKIQRANLDGSNVEDLVTQGLEWPDSIALDVAVGKMYWTDGFFGTAKIQRANLDGSNVEDLVTQGLGSPQGIALDVAAGKMYWIDRGTAKIQRANLDGSNIQDLVTRGLDYPQGIALDVAAGKMYWIDSHAKKLQRANLDGSNVEDLVTQGLEFPDRIALDVAAGKMYWTDTNAHKIQRANLDGTEVEDIITGLISPDGIALGPPSQTTPPAPELVVEASVVPAILSPGEQFELSATLENSGTGPSTATTLRYYGSNNNIISTDDRQLGTSRGDPLAVNATIRKYLSVTAPTTPGIYYYGVCVDSVTDEIYTNNNCSSALIVTVTEPPGVAEGVNQEGVIGRTLYWTDYDTDKIQSVNLDGSNIQDLVTRERGLRWSLHIALDVTAGKMYWTGGGKIQSVNLDGSNIQDLVTQGLEWLRGIALDVTAGKMYWIDSNAGKLQRANLDGSNVEDLVTQGLSAPSDIALDVAAGKMYWADTNTNKLQRANLDGSNVEDLVTQGLESPWGIALDVAAGKMYWADASTGKLQRANLDGSNVEDLVTQGLESPRGIALDVAVGKMYWTDASTGKIQRANLDGTAVQDIITGLYSPNGIALAISSQTTPSKPDLVVEKDVNQDDVVDIKDLVFVAERYGRTGTNPADVNGDKVVNVIDFVLVAAVIDAAAAAPALSVQGQLLFTPTQLRQWLAEARALGNTSLTYQKGIQVLEDLLALLPPQETALLANYPNPFNPETWIPYQLSKLANVTLHIYAANGQIVRTLTLGHQPAGIYESRSRAAYWDGRNALGEPVASGIYFYTFTAGDFTATRKMLIRK